MAKGAAADAAAEPDFAARTVLPTIVTMEGIERLDTRYRNLVLMFEQNENVKWDEPNTVRTLIEVQNARDRTFPRAWLPFNFRVCRSIT